MVNAQAVLMLWIPVVLVMFAMLRTQLAAMVAVVAATMVLPVATIGIAGLPNLNKDSITALAVVVATVLFANERLTRLRFRLPDALVLIWTGSGFVSAMAYGTGWYEGVSMAADYFLTWGLPYFLGRLYFRDAQDFYLFVRIIIVAGLVYIPFCLFEMRIAPILHQWVYGYAQHALDQQIRWGGWRPMVFMNHGLMLGFWMCSIALVAYWQWRSKAITQLAGVPMGLIVTALAVIAVLTRSTGAIALALMGLMVLLMVGWRRSLMPVYLLLLAVPVYIAIRVSGVLRLETIMWFIETFNIPRPGSLFQRFRSEQLYIDTMWQTPGQVLFGRGWFTFRLDARYTGFDRYEAHVIYRQAVTDALWLVLFARGGLVHVFTVMGLYFIGPWRLLRSFTRAELFSTAGAPLLVMTLVIATYNVDNLLNAMHNPVYLFVVGGMIEVAARRKAIGLPILDPDFQPLADDPDAPHVGLRGVPAV